MYKDEEEKKRYYINQIMHEFMAKGQYINSEYAEALSKNIDLRLPILRWTNPMKKSRLNVGRINTALKEISKDFELLEGLIDDCKKDVQRAKVLSDHGISHLEFLAKASADRMTAEMHGGINVFFNSDRIAEPVNNTISLGEIKITPGAKILFLSEPNSVLKITNQDNSYHIPSGSYVTTNAKHTLIEHRYTSAEKKYTGFYIPIEAKENNEYYVFGGQNKISFIKNSSHELINKNFEDDIIIRNKGTVKFYIMNKKPKTEVTVKYNKEPIYKSFKSNTFFLDKLVNKIALECPDDFLLNYTTEEEVFATYTMAEVRNGVLFCQHTPAKDFKIIEKVAAEPVTFNANISTRTPIKYVSIRELPYI